MIGKKLNKKLDDLGPLMRVLWGYWECRAMLHWDIYTRECPGLEASSEFRLYRKKQTANRVVRIKEEAQQFVNKINVIPDMLLLMSVSEPQILKC